MQEEFKNTPSKNDEQEGRREKGRMKAEGGTGTGRRGRHGDGETRGTGRRWETL
jgi:hypothetical protein